MPCDTKLKPNQTITQRKLEITEVVDRIQKGLVNGNIKLALSSQGAVAFNGIDDAAKNNVTDACIYRRIMATGSALAKAKIAAAQALLGKQAVTTNGTHSHDGGKTWHGSHKH
jgi:hypothetical protein